MQDLPERLSMQIAQAPLSWVLPMRKDTAPQPPFKVEVELASATPLSTPPLAVHPHILTQEELTLGAHPDEDSFAPWRAPPFSEPAPLFSLCAVLYRRG